MLLCLDRDPSAEHNYVLLRSSAVPPRPGRFQVKLHKYVKQEETSQEKCYSARDSHFVLLHGSTETASGYAAVIRKG
jgi:hypothetical protein